MADMAALRAKYRRFEWPAALVAGIGAYIVGYVSVTVYVIGNTIASGTIPWPPNSALISSGFAFYNSHVGLGFLYEESILVVTDVPPGANVAGFEPFSLVARTASEPLIYYSIPVLVLLAVAILFTRWREPAEPDGGLAVATGAGMTIGYLLCMLIGTYIFVRQEGAVIRHLDRLATLLYGLLYPLVLGTVGSLGTQLFLTD
jgi:hypothetical protein